MKTSKYIPFFFVCGLVGWLALSGEAAGAGPVTRRGPDLLHFATRNRVAGTEAAPNIRGLMLLHFDERGHFSRESFLLTASGLETNSTAAITAFNTDDISNIVTADMVPTDRRGRVRAFYLSRVPAPIRVSRIPTVPAVLSPVTEIRAICMENTSEQLIASASVHEADTFQYIVRRNLTQANPDGTAAGSMNLVANQRRVGFSLLAGGLDPNAEYMLVLNSTPVGTVTANQVGRILVRGWPVGAPQVLEVRSLSLVDSGGNTVLSTALPR